jgi:hypothetical protein
MAIINEGKGFIAQFGTVCTKEKRAEVRFYFEGSDN